MKKFVVYYVSSASSSVEVEAETAEDARMKADEEFSSPVLCHHCASGVDLGDWHWSARNGPVPDLMAALEASLVNAKEDQKS